MVFLRVGGSPSAASGFGWVHLRRTDSDGLRAIHHAQQQLEANHRGESDGPDDENQPDILFGFGDADQRQAEEHSYDRESPLEMDARQVTPQGQYQQGIQARSPAGLDSRATDQEVQTQGDA